MKHTLEQMNGKLDDTWLLCLHRCCVLLLVVSPQRLASKRSLLGSPPGIRRGVCSWGGGEGRMGRVFGEGGGEREVLAQAGPLWASAVESETTPCADRLHALRVP